MVVVTVMMMVVVVVVAEVTVMGMMVVVMMKVAIVVAEVVTVVVEHELFGAALGSHPPARRLARCEVAAGTERPVTSTSEDHNHHREIIGTHFKCLQKECKRIDVGEWMWVCVSS